MNPKYKKHLKSIGVRLKRLRKERGITQQELAYDCEVNLSTIQRIEAGTQNITLNILYTLAEVLKIKVEDFFKD